MNIVIFGGTFDPVHNGHLRIAKAAAKRFDAKVVFVPANSPRWKEPTASSFDRLEMLKIALENSDFNYEISDYELNSHADVNYSIDTVKYFKKIYPNDTLYFLIGCDQVNQFNKWKDAHVIASLAQIIFSHRPRYEVNKENVEEFKMFDLEFQESGDVSSTEIEILECLDLPENVRHYIETKRLYFIKKLASFIPEKRLNHSISVANLALKIAVVNKLENPEKYYIAGLLHDLGKTYYKEDENLLELMKKHYPEFLDIPNFAYHQFVGELLAKREFGIEDPAILDAIKFHCTGKANMTSLGMVVYTSDKIDPLRDFDSTWLMDSCFKNWKQGFLDTLEDNRKYLREHNKDISNKLTDECFKMYLK